MELNEILKTLQYKANNLNEACFGLIFKADYLKETYYRKNLIEEIEIDLKDFIDALNKLKGLDDNMNDERQNLKNPSGTFHEDQIRELQIKSFEGENPEYRPPLFV